MEILFIQLSDDVGISISKNWHWWLVLWFRVTIIHSNVFKGKCRRELIISRLRLRHTVLKSTLFLMGKCILDKYNDNNVPENVEHIIM